MKVCYKFNEHAQNRTEKYAILHRMLTITESQACQEVRDFVDDHIYYCNSGRETEHRLQSLQLINYLNIAFKTEKYRLGITALGIERTYHLVEHN